MAERKGIRFQRIHIDRKMVVSEVGIRIGFNPFFGKESVGGKKRKLAAQVSIR
ncbi:MAG: hypothetical protein KAU03_01770 [Candidatus Altiarchaeales archaeon]|nr:hypothetical protein [Candidatus Altiarchaeales archaeon]